MSTTFPLYIDSSMLADFRACPQRFFRKYMEHWKPRAANVHLHAGKAFADGLEAARNAFYVQGKGELEAQAEGLKALMETYGEFVCPDDSAKSLIRMAGALEYYFANYPLTTDPVKPLILPSGKRAIEFSFARPLPFSHPETGDPILYVGRADMIATFAGGRYVFDDKTTSSLGPSWAGQWDLRSQFTGYCWAAREEAIKVDGVIVRGISILKTKYETQQALTYREGWKVSRWLEQVVRDLTRMQRMWEVWHRDPSASDAWDYNLNGACTEYGGCVFKRVCTVLDPQPWLEADFEPRLWNPFTREETLLFTQKEVDEGAEE